MLNWDEFYSEGAPVKEKKKKILSEAQKTEVTKERKVESK